MGRERAPLRRRLAYTPHGPLPATAHPQFRDGTVEAVNYFNALDPLERRLRVPRPMSHAGRTVLPPTRRRAVDVVGGVSVTAARYGRVRARRDAQ